VAQEYLGGAQGEYPRLLEHRKKLNACSGSTRYRCVSKQRRL
jgi:hypothetical protein